MRKLAALPFLVLIWVYQKMLSPFTAPSCRFAPVCSSYAREAIQVHGACAGGWLALKRLARCHPWGGEGFDPVPKKKEEHAKH